jgi:hypothetical protein
MEARNFEEDLRNSDNPNLRNNWIKIFKAKFGQDIEVIWKDNLDTQKGLGTDITIKTDKGRRYSVELKTRKNSSYGKDWIMEIISHIYDKQDKETRNHLFKKEGWIYTATAEYIFHATLTEDGEDIVECIFYSLVPFKTERWKSEFDKFKNLWLSTEFSNGNFQLTLNKLVPESIIKNDAMEFWKWLK